MIDDIEIRKAFLNPRARKRIKQLSLGKTEIEIVELVQCGERTTRDIAQLMNVAMNSISTQLNTLYKKGYLRRKQVTAPSGGYEFEYYSVYSV